MRLNIHHTCGCSMLYGPFPANGRKTSMQPCPICCAVERLNGLAEDLVYPTNFRDISRMEALIESADIVMEGFCE